MTINKNNINLFSYKAMSNEIYHITFDESNPELNNCSCINFLDRECCKHIVFILQIKKNSIYGLKFSTKFSIRNSQRKGNFTRKVGNCLEKD